MLDLDRASALADQVASAAGDDAPITVSARWLKQAIHEIGTGRFAQQQLAVPTAALDYRTWDMPRLSRSADSPPVR